MKKLGLTLLIVVLLGMPAMALAQEKPAAPAAAPAVKADDVSLKGMLKGVIAGTVIGLTVAFLGYAKDKAPDKKFDLKAAAPTVILSIVIGILYGWDQKSIQSLDDWKNAAATILVGELGLKAGWRNLTPIISSVLSSLGPKKA